MNKKVKNMCYIALMACVMAICSQIKIDIPGYVPITMQTLAVYFTALLFNKRISTSVTIIYLCMGACSLPVFTGFQGGLGVLFNYSGGYIFAFPIMAYIISLTKDKWHPLIAMVIATIICYSIGTLWFMFITKMTLMPSLMMCVIPFIPGDIIKMVIAWILSKKIKIHL